MCLFPIDAYISQYVDFYTGELKRKVYFKPRKDAEEILLPCNKCLECQQQHSLSWSYRLMNEASLHNENCFLTLTYNKQNLLSDSLVKRDFQLFMKRLRKAICPVKIKFFACGEYGARKKRPHFHCVIFGWCPKDLQLYNKEQNLYGSKFVESIWQKGFISVGEVNNIQVVKYLTKYLQKYVNYEESGLVKPFLLMSNGLGKDYFLKNKDSLLRTDKIYYNGNYLKLPRYYLNLSKDRLLDTLKENRIKKAVIFKDVPKNYQKEKNLFK